MVRHRALTPALSALVAVVAACASSGAGLVTLEFDTGAGGRPHLSVEVASEPQQLAKGLSGRAGLARDRGMLFVIDERGSGFWNKDVRFDLSLAFVSACGVIVDLQQMAAGSPAIHDTPFEYRYAIEANKSWFERHGIRLGDRVILPESIGSSRCRSL